ncbi:LysR family transcriptional regulator [Streptomyces sp. NPDC050560]|uniref:LysR family transcriptional regulator n=1 Tax=Streptomyces sp. NPDC050560 TaxID=3365630 RepID=UPI0037B577C4
MDRLLVMRSLVAVADTESFADAAEAVRTSASSVSRHITSLEKRLGVRLINRTARSVTLTENGARYTAFARRVLGEIEREERSLARAHTSLAGTLSVICPKWLGSLDLGDAIADFSVRHPDIEVRLALGGVQERPYAFLDDGFDVSFYTRPIRDSRMSPRRIATLPFVLCAAPAYLDARGRPREVHELAGHDCLTHDHEVYWRLAAGGGQQVHKISRSAFGTNSYLALQKAAVRGRGIALLPLRSAYEAVAAGELEVLFHGRERSLCAVHAAGAATPRRVGALLDFVGRWFEEHPAPGGGRPAPTG